MKLRRLRLRLAVLFGLVTALLAIGPLLLWRSAQSEAIRSDFEEQLVSQMESLQRAWIDGDLSVIDFPAWEVNPGEGWSNPLGETDLEPPLITWA